MNSSQDTPLPPGLSAEIKQMKPQQLYAFVRSITPTEDQNWRDKLQLLLDSVEEVKQLESIGKALSLEQAFYLLELSVKTDQHYRDKFPPLFVGMQHPVFQNLVMAATPSQMDLLKEEGFSEPFLHQLTYSSHDLSGQLQIFGDELLVLETEIREMPLLEWDSKTISSIIDRIEKISKKYKQVLNKSKKFLALAWNSERTDLVEGLSHTKELAEKILKHHIGFPRTKEVTASGLYGLLGSSLEKIYGNSEDPYDVEALSDEEPAIEAIVRFSIWYLQDYKDVGLLPKTDGEHGPDEASLSPEEKEILYQQAKENLTRIGLSTVRDLKGNNIYSKKALVDHIRQNTNKLL